MGTLDTDPRLREARLGLIIKNIGSGEEIDENKLIEGMLLDGIAAITALSEFEFAEESEPSYTYEMLKRVADREGCSKKKVVAIDRKEYK
jgi:hypothetical protein